MPLFHPRIISRITDNAPRELQEEHAEIIQNWAATIESRAIYQQSEVAIHGHFTQRILIGVLGYTGFDNREEWTLQPECPVGPGTVDVALGHFTVEDRHVVAPFELKPATLRDLDAIMSGRNKTPVQQAWEYAMDAPGARWVLVSNYVEIRLYAVGFGRALHESWNLRKLTDPKEFARFHTLLCAENLLGGYTLQLLQESEAVQEEITNALYSDYRQVRARLFRQLREAHLEKTSRQILRLAQTILDRILFIAFAEDTGLLPPNVLDQTYAQHNPFTPVPVWQNFLGLFRAIDEGQILEIEGARVEIPAYNGGLFQHSQEIAELQVSDEICEAFRAIGRYEFKTEVSVEVLGHILEQSITDLEELSATEDDEEFDERLSRRRTEGVYYTPAFVTRYMIEQTLGRVLESKKQELGQGELPKLTDDDYASVQFIQRGKNKGQVRYNAQIGRHVEFWSQYQAALSEIKVLDPACGSGAFLIAAFDYLLNEGNIVNAELANLVAGQHELFRWDTHILERNLFGVDINSESVEITKLSLWLKTANPRQPLTYLDNNIRAGNSVVDTAVLAPGDAFNWPDFAGGEFDVVVTNPPYVSALELSRHLGKETKDYWKERFAAATGAYDLYVLFMELSLMLVRDDGFVGLITPNKYLAAPYGVGIRNLIRDTAQLYSVLNLSADHVFQDPSVYPIVSILQKSDNRDNATAYAERDANTGRVSTIRKLEARYIDALPNRMFSLILSAYSDELSAVLGNCSRLIDIAKVNATSTASEADILSQVIIEHEAGAAPMVNTGTIDRYMSLWGIQPLTAQHRMFTKPAIQLDDVELSDHRRKIYAAPKIIFAKIALRPEAVFDAAGELCSINTNCVYESELPLEYLVGVLNSKAMAFIYDQFFGSLRMSGGYLQFQSPQLRALPIPTAKPDAVQVIVDQVRRIQTISGQIIDIKRNLVGLAVADFGLDGTTKKFGNFEALSWQQFCGELKKHDIEFVGAAREDWFERFEQRKTEILALQDVQGAADRELDRQVCSAFGFDDSLIARIEEQVSDD